VSDADRGGRRPAASGTLVDQALEAAGGLAAWRQADAWQATLSTGGLAFRTRGRTDLHQLHATVATCGQRVTLDGFPRSRYRAIWDAGRTRIDQPDGRLLEQRTVTNWGRRWDDLDMAAFASPALWLRPCAGTSGMGAQQRDDRPRG
jgi:hypothetical protein